ncbi:hypothetical protein FEM48_Zijuj12G0089600 [Ziziphus jujuba var. spinosa]|uniref:Uncharacterized protein n=1 Tax=Ziziphus jujuba var. spinosa TaxID=714518 RepID=A0A978UCD3_ZIZJJ|nr:hypothetical protein FEM48_Zijuj12G0089600 [Ziziphus jujuba var. spinosa]
MQKIAVKNEAVEVGEELLKLTNNITSRMSISKSCCDNENEANLVRKLVKETAEITGKFNLSDYIELCKNIDLQGFGRKLKEIRDDFDTMMERIVKEHEEARKEGKRGGGNGSVKDLLDILLDISEDESSEIRLTRQDIMTFILVKC